MKNFFEKFSHEAQSNKDHKGKRERFSREKCLTPGRFPFRLLKLLSGFILKCGQDVCPRIYLVQAGSRARWKNFGGTPPTSQVYHYVLFK